MRAVDPEGKVMDALPYILLLASPICWASWLNFKLLCKNWRFESFYINYALSIVAITFGYGWWTEGTPMRFLDSVFAHGLVPVAQGVGAGVIWGVGNILLVAAIIMCGLAVGLKIAIGLSLVLGVALTYFSNPGATARPAFLLAGVVVIGIAILANGTAYRIREDAAGTRRTHYWRGLFITVICGVLIGTFPLLQGLAIKQGMGGVQTAFLLTVGDLLVAIPLLPLLARHPVLPQDRPVLLGVDYRRGKAHWHIWAILAGAVWAVGTITNLIVAVEHFGLSIAWAVGECSPLVGFLWGLFVFKEFNLPDKRARRLAYRWLTTTFFLYIAGIGLLFAAA